MIKVIIERHVAEELADHYDKIARDTLQKAMAAHGFISGESLRNLKDPNHRVVMATYRTVQDWDRWHHSDERRAMMDVISQMLEGEEKITILEH